MPSIPVYTIGYGNRSIGDFIKLLQVYDIKFLVDIRSQPYSRYNPDFSKEDLEKYLKQHLISYVYMGDTLGGRPKDSSCYTDDGRVNYTILREKDFYQRGISRLRTAWEKQLPFAIMCSEARPQECHRGKLIGNTLLDKNMGVAHIDESGNIKTQEEINQIFTNRQPSLFDQGSQSTLNEKIGISRKKYVQARESA
jgi:uncharacterized protein (DUF488 family)